MHGDMGNKMFENFRIKRLQEKIFTRGRHRENIRKIIEELKELQTELEMFLLRYEPFMIESQDMKKVCGNIQKEIADAENVIQKAKMMFVRTSQQRTEYMASKHRIIQALKIYLKGR